MDEYAEHQDAWQPDNEVAIRLGCVRVTDGTHAAPVGGLIANPGLKVHTNTGHTSVGISEVWIEEATGRIRIVTPDSLNGVPIITGDETAAEQGLLFGGSGGNGHVNISCAKIVGGVAVKQNLASQSVYDAVASGGLNLWCLWVQPLVRGVGLPAKADRALTAVTALEAMVADLTTRVELLEAG